jgi:hypothetical protein
MLYCEENWVSGQEPLIVPFVVVAHGSHDTGVSELTLLEDIDNLPKLMASGPLGKLVTQGEIEKSLSEGKDSQHE